MSDNTENLGKRTVYQVHCNACDNDTIHAQLGDFVTCDACGISQLTYIANKENLITEVAPPAKEKSAAEKVKDQQRR